MNKTYIGQDKQPKGKPIVYWIHAPEHSDILTQGYVGITTQSAKTRWDAHIRDTKRKNHQFGHVLKTQAELIFDVVLIGEDRAYCELMEHRLRPIPNIGWNIAPGGKDGYCLIGGQINKQRWKRIRPEGDCIKWHNQEIALLKRLHKQQQRAKEVEARRQFESVKWHSKPRKIDIRSKSGLTGVAWHKPYSLWKSQLMIDGVPIMIGYFADKYQAHKAYQLAKSFVVLFRQGNINRKQLREKVLAII